VGKAKSVSLSQEGLNQPQTLLQSLFGTVKRSAGPPRPMMATPGVAARATRADIHLEPRFSDHAPLTIDDDLTL
jgi:hypothetical protein